MNYSVLCHALSQPVWNFQLLFLHILEKGLSDKTDSGYLLVALK